MPSARALTADAAVHSLDSRDQSPAGVLAGGGRVLWDCRIAGSGNRENVRSLELRLLVQRGEPGGRAGTAAVRVVEQRAGGGGVDEVMPVGLRRASRTRGKIVLRQLILSQRGEERALQG